MSIEDFYDPKEMRANQIIEGLDLFATVVGYALVDMLRSPPQQRDEATLLSLLEDRYQRHVERESVTERSRLWVRALLNVLQNRIKEDFDAE